MGHTPFGEAPRKGYPSEITKTRRAGVQVLVTTIMLLVLVELKSHFLVGFPQSVAGDENVDVPRSCSTRE